MLCEVVEEFDNYTRATRLNPCSVGICSVSPDEIWDIVDAFFSLNPCSVGICSVREHSAGEEYTASKS